MKVWQIVKAFEIGSYIEGCAFENELGQRIEIREGELVVPKNAKFDSEWQYVGPYAQESA